MRLAWDKSQSVSHIGCHAKVAPSVGRVFQKVHAHYGDAELKRLRLDLFGGCFANRKKRGGSTWSTHAWAVALDFDPERNQLKWGRDRASLDHPRLRLLVAHLGGRGLGQPGPVAQLRLDACAGGAVDERRPKGRSSRDPIRSAVSN